MPATPHRTLTRRAKTLSLRGPSHPRLGGPRRAGRDLGERGSGTAIGVAVMFPFLMLVIVLVGMLNDTARTEQALQAAADRAAHAASLCCERVGGAEAVAAASLDAALLEPFIVSPLCTNDIAASRAVVFENVDGNRFTAAADADRRVPPGGTVYVYVTCRIPPRLVGGFGLPGLNPARTSVGVAAVDPYRQRGDQ